MKHLTRELEQLTIDGKIDYPTFLREYWCIFMLYDTEAAKANECLSRRKAVVRVSERMVQLMYWYRAVMLLLKVSPSEFGDIGR